MTCASPPACGDAATGAGWTGSIDTLADGTVVVTSPEEGYWGQGEAWRLERVARIGALEGEGPEVFGRIAAVELGEDGLVYVLDGQAREVRVFDTAGAFVRRFGREGGGPGEFRSPAWLEVGPDGRTWVADPSSRRITAFNATGQHVAELPWGSFGGYLGATHRVTSDAILEEVGIIERMETERGRSDRWAGRAVIRQPYSGDEPQPAWYDVFDPDGRFLGSLAAPVDARPAPRITGEHLVGAVRDSFDVQYVELYRIERPSQ